MKKFTTVGFVILITTFLYSQSPLNVNLLGSLNPYPGKGFSSLWGYTAGDGREYALLGVEDGTSIIDITNPSLPVEVDFVPGPTAFPYHWREMKTHSHYAYIVSEGSGSGSGMQIVDLSYLPDSVVLVSTYNATFTTAHNIYIDNGHAYVVGVSNGGGMHILDLANPVAPLWKSYFTGVGYIHDVYVWNDTAYTSSADRFDLVNVSNKSTPVLVSQGAALPGIYAHSGWLTEDKRYFLACEEFNERDLTVWDLQDRSSWSLVNPEWQMPGNNPIHNIFIKGDYAHIAYYKDGYIVLDISDPVNPVLVGQYDTYANSTPTYAGAWNCYPFFNSGSVIISDMQTGLYVFDFLLDNNVPVELSSFTAKVSGNSVNLNWITATELNNRGFEIERAFINSKSVIANPPYRTIGFVEGAGTTTSQQNYFFNDNSINQSGTYYYRLKQIDSNGNFEYSDKIMVTIVPNDFSLKQNFPNPFNPSTKISWHLPVESHVVLKIYNVLGKEISTLVNEKKPAGEYEIEFNSNGLPSGLYFAKLEAGDFTKTIKMTLLK